jgi:hypothetical protein
LLSAGNSIAELLDGEVHKREWTLDHVSAYQTILNGFDWSPVSLTPRHGWMIDFRPEIHVDEHIFVPDFAGWKAHRRIQPVPFSAYCDRSATRYEGDVPDWVGDIVEDSNVGLIRNIKLPFYHRLGITSLWLINCIRREFEIYSATAAGWQLDARFEGKGRLRAAPFDKIEFDLECVWDSD